MQFSFSEDQIAIRDAITRLCEDFDAEYWLGLVGVMQYINPTLQFAVAALVFAEPVTRWHWIAFPLIWIAVALYSVETISQDRATRRLLESVAT